MVEIKDQLSKEANALLLRELKHLTDAQFDGVMKKLMADLKLEHRKIRNKPTYYYADVVSTKDLNRETFFVNKSEALIGPADVKKLYDYSEKVRAPRSTLVTFGEVSRDAEQLAGKCGVRLIRGSDLASSIRRLGLEDMILKEFAQDNLKIESALEDVTLEGQTMLGIELMQAGDLVRAMEHFDKAIASNPNSDIIWRLKGNVLDLMGHHNKALECYARSLELNDKSAELWHSIGASMYATGRYDEELQAYENALRLDSRQEKTLLNKSVTLLKLGRYQESIDTAEIILKMNPKLVKVHNNKGIALKKLGRNDESLQAFGAAIAYDNEFADAWANKGSLLIQMERLSEALPCFEQLVSISPRIADAWKTKGDIESLLGKTTAAVASYEKALEISPTDEKIKKALDSEKAKIVIGQSDLHAKISTIFSRSGVKIVPQPIPIEPEPISIQPKAQPGPAATRPEAAVQEAETTEAIEEPPAEEPVIPEEGLVLEPEEIDEPLTDIAEEVFGDSAELMLLMKRPELALKEVEKGLRLEPLSSKMNQLKGFAYYAMGKKEEALKSLTRALELEQDKAEFTYSIEFILSSLGRHGEAEESLKPLLDGSRWIPEVLAAMDSFAAGKMKKVEEHMEVAISLEPSAIAWNYKGLLDLNQGDFENAISAFDRARELEEVFSDPSNNTAVAHFKLQANEEASNCYDQAISSEPRNHVAWSNRGVMLYTMERYKEAVACFDQSLLFENDHLVLINKGFTQLSMDLVEDALKSFEASLLIKETPEGYNDRGIALARLGKTDEAVECFQKAIQMNPEYEDAHHNLAQYEAEEAEEEAEEEIAEPLSQSSLGAMWKAIGPVEDSSLNRMKKNELVDICEGLGLSTKGTKKDMVDRIIKAHKAYKKGNK